jgi:hypothetical protein
MRNLESSQQIIENEMEDLASNNDELRSGLQSKKSSMNIITPSSNSQRVFKATGI